LSAVEPANFTTEWYSFESAIYAAFCTTQQSALSAAVECSTELSALQSAIRPAVNATHRRSVDAALDTTFLAA
jgi:hypothetical protein